MPLVFDGPAPRKFRVGEPVLHGKERIGTIIGCVRNFQDNEFPYTLTYSIEDWAEDIAMKYIRHALNGGNPHDLIPKEGRDGTR